MSRRNLQDRKVNIQMEDIEKARQSGYCLNISQVNKDGEPKKAPLSGAKNRWSNPANENFIFIEEPLFVAGHKTDVEEYLNRYPEEKKKYLELAFTKENTGETGKRNEEFNIIVKRQKEASKLAKKEENNGKTEKQRKMDEKIALLEMSSDIVKDINNNDYKIVTKSQTEIPIPAKEKVQAVKRKENEKVGRGVQSLVERIKEAEKDGYVLNISDISETGTNVRKDKIASNPKSRIQVGSLPVIVSNQKKDAVDTFFKLLEQEDKNATWEIKTIRSEYDKNCESMKPKAESEKKEAKVPSRVTKPSSPKKSAIPVQVQVPVNKTQPKPKEAPVKSNPKAKKAVSVGTRRAANNTTRIQSPTSPQHS